jgi:hypothetical protein
LKLDGVGRHISELQGTLSNRYCPLIVPRFSIAYGAAAHSGLKAHAIKSIASARR